jgi:serine/threonine protein kinase
MLGRKLIHPQYDYATPERPHSELGFTDIDTNERLTFEPTRLLGEGKNGQVRLFKNIDSDNPEVFAVKKLLALENNNIEAATYELRFLEKAYPNEGVYEICFLQENKTPIPKSIRIIMPYFQGTNAISFTKKVPNSLYFAFMLLELTRELRRLHHQQIIHGDLHVGNVLIHHEANRLIIHWIDFAWAYHRHGYATSVHERCEHWAPERTQGNYELEAHPSQDVFSFGYMIKQLHTSWQRHHPCEEAIITQYSSINDFIQTAMQHDPNARPTLERFHDALTVEYYVYYLKKILDKDQYLSFNERFHRDYHRFSIDQLGTILTQLLSKPCLAGDSLFHTLASLNDLTAIVEALPNLTAVSRHLRIAETMKPIFQLLTLICIFSSQHSTPHFFSPTSKREEFLAALALKNVVLHRADPICLDEHLESLKTNPLFLSYQDLVKEGFLLEIPGMKQDELTLPSSLSLTPQAINSVMDGSKS